MDQPESKIFRTHDSAAAVAFDEHFGTGLGREGDEVVAVGSDNPAAEDEPGVFEAYAFAVEIVFDIHAVDLAAVADGVFGVFFRMKVEIHHRLDGDEIDRRPVFENHLGRKFRIFSDRKLIDGIDTVVDDDFFGFLCIKHSRQQQHGQNYSSHGWSLFRCGNCSAIVNQSDEYSLDVSQPDSEALSKKVEENDCPAPK